MDNYYESRNDEFRDYVKMYRAMVANIVKSAIKGYEAILSNEDVNDILQDSIIVLYEKKKDPTFQLTVKESTYLHSVASNKTKELLRKRNKIEPLADSYDQIDPVDGDNDTIEFKNKFLKECLDLMQGNKKNVLKMFFFDNIGSYLVAI